MAIVCYICKVVSIIRKDEHFFVSDGKTYCNSHRKDDSQRCDWSNCFSCYKSGKKLSQFKCKKCLLQNIICNDCFYTHKCINCNSKECYNCTSKSKIECLKCEKKLCSLCFDSSHFYCSDNKEDDRYKYNCVCGIQSKNGCNIMILCDYKCEKCEQKYHNICSLCKHISCINDRSENRYNKISKFEFHHCENDYCKNKYYFSTYDVHDFHCVNCHEKIRVCDDCYQVESCKFCNESMCEETIIKRCQNCNEGVTKGKNIAIGTCLGCNKILCSNCYDYTHYKH